MTRMNREFLYDWIVSIPSGIRPVSNRIFFTWAGERLLRLGILLVLVTLCQPALANQTQMNSSTDSNSVGPETGEHQRLTLELALDIARRSNPALVAKRGEIDIAEGNLQQASIIFQRNPELSVRSDSRRIPRSSNPPSDSERLSEYEIEISQEFEVWGQPRARRSAAAAARDTTQASILALEYKILTMVRHQFYSARIAQHSVNLASAQFGFSQSILDMSRTQFEAGEISRTDYRQLEIQSAAIRTRVLLAKSELETALNELKFTLGLSPSTPLLIDGTLLPPQVSSLEPAAIVARIIENHPDLRQAELLVTQREKEEIFVRKEAKPNITGSVFFAEEDENEKLYGVGLSIPIQFFNRGRGSKAAARASVRVAAAEESAMRSSIRSRAVSTVDRLRAAGEAAAYYYEEVLPAIQANLEQLENAFQQGEIDMIELRVNQRDLLDAQSDALDRLGDSYYWLAEVEGMMGQSLFDANNQIQSELEANQ